MEYVWVVRKHDQYENASYTESAWTTEEAARAYIQSKCERTDEYGRTVVVDVWPYSIDRVKINTPAGYD